MVDGATLRCTLGTSTSKLTVPTHRHIKITGKRMANRADVNYEEQCIGSFGYCKISSPPPACTYRVLVPWQDTQDDVFAAKQDAVLETSWTICMVGGKITVVSHGQGVSDTETAIKNIEELEKVARVFLGEDTTVEEVNELVKGILLWGDYEETPWKMTTNKTKMKFGQYLEKKHKDLAEYFSSKIEINDPLGEETLDLSYLAGCLQADRQRGDTYLYNMTDEALNNPAQMNAHIDAYLIGQEYDEKNTPFSELLKSAYGLGDVKETSSFQKNGRYKTLLQPIYPRYEGVYIPKDIFQKELNFWDSRSVDFKRLGATYLSSALDIDKEKVEGQSDKGVFHGVTDKHMEDVEAAVRENFEKEKQRRMDTFTENDNTEK